MLSLDTTLKTDFTPVLALIRRWSLALTAAQQLELQASIRAGISADDQVAMRTIFREQNAHLIVNQFLEMIKLPELKHFLRHEEHVTLIVNRMRETLACNFNLFFQKITQSRFVSMDIIDRFLEEI